MASLTRDGYQRLHDDLEAEIADMRDVIDLVIAGLRYASTDVAMAYAELHAERGNVRPIAELKARRELKPVEDQLADAVAMGHRKRVEILQRLARRRPWLPDHLTPSIDELLRRPGEGWWGR